MVELRGERERIVGEYHRSTDNDEQVLAQERVSETVEGGYEIRAQLSAESMVGGAYTHTVAGPLLRIAAWCDIMAWGGWLESDVRTSRDRRAHDSLPHELRACNRGATDHGVEAHRRSIDQARALWTGVGIRNHLHARECAGRRCGHCRLNRDRRRCARCPNRRRRPMESNHRPGEEQQPSGSSGQPDAQSRDFGNPPPVTTWRRPGQTRLDALLDFVPRWGRPPGVTPWEPGHEIRIQSLGGIVSKERRRYTIVGHGEFHRSVLKHRNWTINSSQKMTHSKSHTVVIGGPGTASSTDTDESGDAPGAPSIERGRDTLEVRGDARLEFHSRTIMMSGFVTRRLENGVVRMASLEGVICGGAFVRAVAGPSANMSPLCSGDVYGGGARSAINRSMLALLHYRAAAAAAWASGVYVRASNIVVEPLLSAPSSPGPRSMILAKLARLAAAANKVLTPLRAVLAPLDILIGLITFVPMLFFGLGMLALSLIRAPIPIPPMGPPRVHQAHGPLRAGFLQHGAQHLKEGESCSCRLRSGHVHRHARCLQDSALAVPAPFPNIARTRWSFRDTSRS